MSPQPSLDVNTTAEQCFILLGDLVIFLLFNTNPFFKKEKNL